MIGGALALGAAAWIGWTGLPQLFTPACVRRGPRRAGRLALTFDDGPDPRWTPRVLDVLGEAGIHATFFLVGERARAHPDLLRRIRAEGHEVGNHTDGMRTTFWRATEAFERDLLRAEATLGLSRAPLKLFRPAGGLSRRSQRAAAARHGYLCVLGSAYPFDPARPPVAYMSWLMRKNLAPGVILILHDSSGDRSRSVAALARVLRDGQARRFRLVTVSQLLAGSAAQVSRAPATRPDVVE